MPQYLGLEGDLLDALVLGPRLALGARVRIEAWGAVTLMDRGLIDDKLVCSHHRPSARECEAVLRFFGFYARAKALLNRLRGRRGRNACVGWLDAETALGRARLRDETWTGPPIGF